MPAIRCKHFSDNGAPIGRGCPTRSCRFVHPNDKANWEALTPPGRSIDVRCKNFDDQGRRSNACGLHCPFIHPTSPLWTRAPRRNSIIERSLPPLPSRLSAHVRTLQGRVDPLVVPSKSNTAESVRMLLPKLQTDLRLENLTKPTSPSRMTEISPGSLPSQRALNPTHGDLPKSFRASSRPPSPSLSLQTPANSKSQPWKTLILYLTQALDLREQIRDLDRRSGLCVADHISALTPSDGARANNFLSDLQQKRKELESKFDTAITKVMELDFWPVPNTEESMVHPDKIATFIDTEALIKRLDKLEAQWRGGNETDFSGEDINAPSLVATTDNADMTRPFSHFPKRLRPPINHPLIQTSDVIRRLDSGEDKMSEIEREWNNEVISERIEDILEIVFERHRDIESREEGAQQPSVEALAELNRDFLDLCNEFAEHMPKVTGLEVELGQFRTETEALKQSTTSMESSTEQMRRELESLSRQSREAVTEIINRQDILNLQPSFTDQRDNLIQAMKGEIQQHITTARADIESLIASLSGNIVLTRTEPVAMKTDVITHSSDIQI